MFSAMLLVMCPICAEPTKPSRMEQAVRLVSPVTGVFITMLESAECIGEEMIRGESEWAPASALTAIAMAEAAKAETAIVKNSDPTDPSEVTAEVAEILDKCEAVSREVKTSKVVVIQTVYNLVFETEAISEGVLYFESPEKRSIDLRSSEVPRGTRSSRIGKSGNPFRLERSRGESWMWLPDEIACGDCESKTFHRLQMTREIRETYSWGWLATLPPPFLFDLQSHQLRLDWKLSLLRTHKDGIILRAIPRATALKRRYSECWILVDDKTWCVTAVKCFDASGNLEVVYKLGTRTINESLSADCFDPTLKWQGYKEFKLD
ncbi:MAG: hypothetical protein JWP89_3522 [Schlesneria sp.]|nr:hypothetical protein [Schlesneria sp.]